MTNNKGSIWTKWDLHIHTPYTKLANNFKTESEDIWKDYCDKIEESDVKVFGITDYFSCDNYITIKEKHKFFYPDSKKVFLPNIELRLDVSVNKGAEEVNIHVIFCNTLSDNTIENFLRKLDTNITNESGANISCHDLKNSFDSATVSLKDIVKTLESIFGKTRPYLIIAASNNAGLRADNNSPRKQIISDEIDKVCDGFFGGTQNVEWFLSKDRYENGQSLAKPVITGCDAHSFEDIVEGLGKVVTVTNNKGNYISKNICWIKGDLTFEGLKQIKYEPKYRVKIDDKEPRQPIRRIESIKFNFPENTFIKRQGSDENQDFCLKTISKPIHFSPNFTCLIGGRGTGKSTIINILGEKLGEKTDFFNKSNNYIEVDSRPYDLESDLLSYVDIEGADEIEFVSQGKVERLAEGEELTKLIYRERIRETESGFFTLEKEFADIVYTIDDNIRSHFDYESIEKTKKDLEKERDNSQNVIDSINDPRYRIITTKIESLQNDILKIDTSREEYETLVERIKNIILETKISEDKNEYDLRIEEIINVLKMFKEISPDGQLSEEVIISETVKLNHEKLNEELLIEKRNLTTFFEERGTSEENIKDSQKASETVAHLKHEIQILDNRLKAFTQKIEHNNAKINRLQDLYNTNELLVVTSLKSINSKLLISNENLQEIKFDYEFDKFLYLQGLFNEFYQLFNKFHISGTSTSNIREFLFSIPPTESLFNKSHEDFYSDLTKLTEKNYRPNSNYVQIVLKIFESKTNYNIYLELIKKHIFDISKYIKIKGYYGKRELSTCSFGQRCTAVIVTLLMTGVKPLVIDEPEAHLDNKLIADYLVDLIKIKKQDRQIIFATHNSNFVINGDAELVHILEIPENSNYTNITSTTIENINNRDKLLKLEGGKAAFLIRENKYGIA